MFQEICQVHEHFGGVVKTATDYNGDKPKRRQPKRRQPKRRQNGKAKTATQVNGDNENGDSFYRATRMHSADSATARCLFVCMSVRPSVRHTPVLCVNGYTYPQSFFTIG